MGRKSPVTSEMESTHAQVQTHRGRDDARRGRAEAESETEMAAGGGGGEGKEVEERMEADNGTI